MKTTIKQQLDEMQSALNALRSQLENEEPSSTPSVQTVKYGRGRRGIGTETKFLIAQMWRRGKDAKTIADELGISVPTVYKYTTADKIAA